MQKGHQPQHGSSCRHSAHAGCRMRPGRAEVAFGQHRGRAVEGCMEEHCLTAAPCRGAAYMYHSLHTGQREMLCSLLKKCERGTGALSWSVAGITGAIQGLQHRHLGGQDTESILCEKCRREGFC